jgi:hypothetical protein
LTWGVYNYPLEKASKIPIKVGVDFENGSSVEQIIFLLCNKIYKVLERILKH